MSRQENRLERARVASPCSVSWESMSGDARARFCEECQLRVYNISELTRRQAEDLIAGTEGRICARLYRRADGTILTKDCPIGLRALRRRLARVAGAAITAILSLGASVLGQTLTRTSKGDAGNSAGTTTITRTFLGLNPQEGRATFFGVVTDIQDIPVPNARATIFNTKTKYKRETKSDEDGNFKFGLLEPGIYTLRIESPGFQTFVQDRLSLHSNEELRFDVRLDIGGILMGVIVCEEPPSKGIIVDGVRVKINED